MAGNAYDDEVAQLVSGEQSPLEQVAAEASLQRALDSLSKTEAYVIYHSVCLDESEASIAWHLGIAEKV